MKETVVVTPDKLAKKSGGDRYKGQLLGKEWQIYLPQEITRTGVSSTVKRIRITIEVLED